MSRAEAAGGEGCTAAGGRRILVSDLGLPTQTPRGEQTMRQVLRPRLLVLLAPLAILAGVFVIAVADDDTADPDRTGAAHAPAVESQTATAEDVAHAERIARESGLMDAVAGPASWTLAVPRSRVATGTERGVQFRAVLEKPISASARWFSIACQGTQRHEYAAAYTNIHAFLFIVDLDDEEVITFGPATLPPVSGDAHLASAPRLEGSTESLRFTVSDLATGRVLESETSLPDCPAGLSDD